MVRALSPPHRRNLALAKQMIKVKRIDHVAIAVAERDAAAASLSALFGLETGAREHVASQATDVAFLHPHGSEQSGQTTRRWSSAPRAETPRSSASWRAAGRACTTSASRSRIFRPPSPS